MKNRKGVFGLTSVQAFFAIILAIALLAYVIIVIMGTLNSNTTLLPASSLTGTVVNESGYINTTGYTLATTTSTVRGFSSPAITLIVNTTDGHTINSGNYTLTGSTIYNSTTSTVNWDTVQITYTYKYDDTSFNNAHDILGNTSSGITGFFSAINPVYSILAILVIILVLVVLVRVVSGEGIGRRMSTPQL